MKRYLITFLLLGFISSALAEEVPSKSFIVNPVSSASTYAAGELIGGKNTVSNALCSNFKTGYVTSIKATDKTGQNAPLDVWIFSDNPAASTFTNNAAFTLHNDDLPRVIANVRLDSTLAFSASANGLLYKGSQAIPIKSSSSNNVYVAVQVQGAPTLVSTSDISLQFVIACDLQQF